MEGLRDLMGPNKAFKSKPALRRPYGPKLEHYHPTKQAPND